MAPYIPWQQAWESAHYGASGFYRRQQNPENHFHTSVMDSRAISQRIFQVALETFLSLGSPSVFTVLDVGAGNNQLTHDLHAAAVESGRNWTVMSHDLSDGDARNLTPRGGNGVVIAHEFLDDIPCTVAEVDADLNFCSVLVEPETGHEQLGVQVNNNERLWLEKWWPATVIGARREVGLARDRAWETLLKFFDHGSAIAIDYSHTLEQRQSGLFDSGTLVGYSHGRAKRPVPDGSMNITAHVSVDSLIETGAELGLPPAILEQPHKASDFRWLHQPLA